MAVAPLAAIPLASSDALWSQTSAAKPVPEASKSEASKYDQPGPFAAKLDFERKDAPLMRSPFALRQVQLGEGPFLQARQWNAAYLKRLPTDRLLYNFRATSGLPAPAAPFGGWEAPDCELRGHFVGHYLSACAHMYAATADADLKHRSDTVVAGMAECQAKLAGNGYVSAFPVEEFTRLGNLQQVWAPFYTLHKLMAGLLDMHTLTANQQSLDVLIALSGWVDAWTGQYPEEHMQAILETEYGGMNDVLYKLALVTRNDRWAQVGDRFTKKRVFTPLALQRDQLRGLHANTHMPQVIGAARRYEISQDARFGNVSEFFWETIATSRTYAAGGSGVREHWEGQPNFMAAEWRIDASHQECCCAYNMMKLCRHLYARRGDERYIDYYERNLYNHRLGTIEPDTGLTTYFLSMSPGAWKTIATEDNSFWCCNGTGVEEFSKLNDTIYFQGADGGIDVNLFIPSTLDWSERGIRIEQSTSFPHEAKAELLIEQAPAQAWPMRIRVPRWVGKGHGVSINGRRLEATASPGSYIEITRVWKKGDRVQVDLPMELRSEPFADDPTLQAFVYGPIVLAGQFPKGELSSKLAHIEHGPDLRAMPIDVPALQAGSRPLDDWLKPVAGSPLTFRTVGMAHDVTMKPLNESWERFAVYWKLA